MRISDWSSDVCSSDLNALIEIQDREQVVVEAVIFRHQDGDDRAENESPRHAGQDAQTGRPGIRKIGPRDRKSVVEGKSVSVRVDLSGRRIIKKKEKMKRVTNNTV